MRTLLVNVGKSCRNSMKRWHHGNKTKPVLPTCPRTSIFFFIFPICAASRSSALQKIYTFMYSTFLKLSFAKKKKTQLFSFPFSMVHFHVLLSSKIHSGPKAAHTHTLIHGRWPHHMLLGEFLDKRIFRFPSLPWRHQVPFASFSHHLSSTLGGHSSTC